MAEALLDRAASCPFGERRAERGRHIAAQFPQAAALIQANIVSVNVNPRVTRQASHTMHP
jgi:hypothetical protein